MTDHFGHEYFVGKATFVDNKGNKDSELYHEIQSGAIYAVSIDFAKVPTSVTEVNSVIVTMAYTRHEVKFDNVPIK
jgi:hypothetical protein